MIEPEEAANDAKDEIICFCSGTSKTQITTLLAKGVDTVEEIAQETGANTGCGSCDILIVELLNHKK